VYFIGKVSKKMAQESGFRGYVKNLDNGDVEAVALLDEESLDHFVAILKEGSAYSKVDDIIIKKCDEEGFTDFSIRFSIRY
jgi:acylphosphatase